jgi:hypothetical protein
MIVFEKIKDWRDRNKIAMTVGQLNELEATIKQIFREVIPTDRTPSTQNDSFRLGYEEGFQKCVDDMRSKL